MPSSQKTRRYVGLDGYRFVAASLVVLFHFNTNFSLGLDGGGRGTAHFALFVDFFFVLSGFVIATSYSGRMAGGADYIAFLRARFGRIYPLHLLTLTPFLLIAAFDRAFHVPVNHPEIIAASGVPATLLLANAWGAVTHDTFNVPAWSISAEWFVYLLAPPLIALARRVSFAQALAFAAAFVVALIEVRTALGLRDWTEATYDYGALRALPTFFGGVALARAVDRAPVMSWPRWWMAHASFASAIILMQFDIRPEFAIAMFFPVIGLAALCERTGRASFISGPVAARLGDASYALYMLHTIVSLPVFIGLRKFGLLGTPGAAVFALATYGTCVWMALASFKRFETPARRWVVAKLTPGVGIKVEERRPAS